MDLRDFRLLDSSVDDIFFFWRFVGRRTVERRALITKDYGDSRDYLQRVLRYFRSQSQMINLGPKLLELRVSGRAVQLQFGAHCVGLARPHILPNVANEEVEVPFIISREYDSHQVRPSNHILAGSRDDAASLVRALDQRWDVDRQSWRAYQAERLMHPIEKLLVELNGSRTTTFPTELERKLTSVLYGQPNKVLAAK